MYQASVTDSCGCEGEPSSGICFLVVMTWRAVRPKISFRSPVSAVVTSIRKVGLSDAYVAGTCSPRLAISSLVKGLGGYGPEVYSWVSRLSSKDRPRSHLVIVTRRGP